MSGTIRGTPYGPLPAPLPDHKKVFRLCRVTSEVGCLVRGSQIGNWHGILAGSFSPPSPGAYSHCPRSAAFRPLQCPTVMVEVTAYALPNDEAA